MIQIRVHKSRLNIFKESSRESPSFLSSEPAQYEFKLRGNPWYGEGDASTMCRHLVLDIIGNLSILRSQFNLTFSIKLGSFTNHKNFFTILKQSSLMRLSSGGSFTRPSTSEVAPTSSSSCTTTTSPGIPQTWCEPIHRYGQGSISPKPYAQRANGQAHVVWSNSTNQKNCAKLFLDTQLCGGYFYLLHS
jgi:hypothetical protein